MKILKKSNLNVKYLPYKEEDIRRLVQNRIGSNKKAYLDLGFEYKYNLVDGLNKLIEWRNS